MARNYLILISALWLAVIFTPFVSANGDCQDISPVLCKQIATSCDVNIIFSAACKKTCGKCDSESGVQTNSRIQVLSFTNTVRNGVTKAQSKGQLLQRSRAQQRKFQNMMKRKLRMQRRNEEKKKMRAERLERKRKMRELRKRNKEIRRKQRESKKQKKTKQTKTKPEIEPAGPQPETKPVDPQPETKPVDPNPETEELDPKPEVEPVEPVIIQPNTINPIEEEPSTENEELNGPEDPILAECFERHNMYRDRHIDTPPLSWDEDLRRSAQRYAEELARTEDFKHSDDLSDRGENLYYGYNSGGVTRDGRCTRALDLWYAEIEHYDFSTGQAINGEVIGHFTQMVWTDSKRIGIGMAINRDGTKIYVVAHYAPKGNFLGQFTKKVKKLK